MEMAGSATNSQRAVQWREKVVEPMFEAKTDYEITYLFARKFGYHEELFKHIAIEKGVPVVEDILREINRGSWTIGYTGQSPERLKQHMQHQGAFHTTSLRGSGDPVEGEYYGLPWPCWGTAELKHQAPPISTTPRSRLLKEACPSAQTGAFNTRAQISSPKAATRRAPN